MEAVAAPRAVPSLPGWPLLGSLPSLQRDILGTFERASKLGDVVRLHFPGRQGFLVTHPEGVKRILVDNHRNYGKRTRGYGMLSIALGQGLVTSQGELWRRQRRIAQPSFHHQRISRFLETMDEASLRMVARWRSQAATGDPLEVSEEMMRVTLEIVGLSLLSTDLSAESGPVGEAISIVLHETVWRITHPLALPLSVPTPRNRRLRDALRRMQDLVAGVIKRRRGGEAQPDLLSMFIEARDEETGEGMTDLQLRDEIMTMVSAGHETTANALTWTLDFLAREPEVRARLEEEVDRVVEDDAPIDLERLRQLEWTEAVIKESMRLRPPVWALARSVESDDEVLGHVLPKGSIVFLSQLILHRDPRFWIRAESFDPERFMGEAGKSISKHLYFPFAGGPRVCIGQAFALMEAKAILARMVRAARFHALDEAPVVPEPVITLRPKGGLAMRIEWRGETPRDG